MISSLESCEFANETVAFFNEGPDSLEGGDFEIATKYIPTNARASLKKCGFASNISEVSYGQLPFSGLGFMANHRVYGLLWLYHRVQGLLWGCIIGFEGRVSWGLEATGCNIGFKG